MVFNCLQQGQPSRQRVLVNKIFLGPAHLLVDYTWLPFSANSGVEALSQPAQPKHTGSLHSRLLTPGCHFRLAATGPRHVPGWVSEGSPLAAPCSLSLLFRAAGVHVPLSWLPAQQASGGQRHCQFSSTPCLPVCLSLSLSALSSLPSRPFPLWHIWKLQLIIDCGLVSVFCFKKTPKVNISSFALLSFPSPLELLP